MNMKPQTYRNSVNGQIYHRVLSQPLQEVDGVKFMVVTRPGGNMALRIRADVMEEVKDQR